MSLWPHIDDIRNVLYETMASCFTISETWLHNMISDDMVSGYTIYLHDRQTVRVNMPQVTNEGGGLAAYIKEDIHVDNM